RWPSMLATRCSLTSISILRMFRARSYCNGTMGAGSTALTGAPTASAGARMVRCRDIIWEHCRQRGSGCVYKFLPARSAWKARRSMAWPLLFGTDAPRGTMLARAAVMVAVVVAVKQYGLRTRFQPEQHRQVMATPGTG